MQTLSDISIKKKLMVLTMLSVLTAMSLACTAFMVNDVRLIKSDMAQQLTALASVLGANTTAALTFDDSETAEQLLNSLEMQPMVTRAILFDATGKVFAAYPDKNNLDALPDTSRGPGYRFEEGHLEVLSELVENDEQLGTIYIEGDMAFIREQIVHYAAIVLLVIVVSCTAALVLASRLQRIISGPILDLTYTAQEISKNNDYRIRASKQGNDELGTLCDEFNVMLDTIEASKKELVEAQEQLELRVEQRTRELSETNSELHKEVGERRRAETKLEVAHRELLDAARKAGMAEIATGVLHNVGNVLNSVNVSATILANQIKGSKTTQLSQVVKLIEQHESDIGTFMSTDAKGKQVPQFLKMLSEHLAADESVWLEEAKSLIENVDHIKTIISTQQSYATSGGMVEPIDVNSLLDDAVKLHSSSFGRHHIQLVLDYAELPTVLIDKQRLLQIVINLLKNAKEALIEQQEGERLLTVKTCVADDKLVIRVSDTGVGITEEQMKRMFSHGFTTKATGHGFGLHSCANAATEMEGRLSVASKGHMQGAAFTLELPFNPAMLPV